MDIEQLREYALAKPDTTEGFPFGESILVFKVSNKMFMLISLDSIPLRMNLKCDSDKAVSLREQYDAIIPGYHMNKKHWNSVIMDGSLSAKLLQEMMDDSYNLIAKKKIGKL